MTACVYLIEKEEAAEVCEMPIFSPLLSYILLPLLLLFLLVSSLAAFPCLICNDCVIRAARQKGGATIISARD